ncbi:MAG: ABC transporter permease [Omnitrophica WOR_2 bacterium]
MESLNKMNCTAVIARLTFQEAARRKILLAALALGVIFLITYAIGFHYLHNDIQSMRVRVNPVAINESTNLLLLAGLYVVNFLTIMMTVLTSVDTLSGEINSGTIHTVVSKPIRRWEVVAGKWLGFAGMLTLYLLLMAGGVMLIIYLIGNYVAPHPIRGLALLWLNAMLVLTISILGGSYLSTLANGVLVFGLYGISFIGGWIEQIGYFLQSQSASQTASNIGVITSLVFPTESIWRRTAYEIQSPLLGALGFSPFTSPSVPSLVMIAYAGLYLVIAFFLAIRQFSRRDL